MKIIQIVIFLIFGFAIVISVLVFSNSKSGTTTGGTVTVWGTFNSRSVSEYFNNFNRVADGAYKVAYVQIPADSFETRLLNALASGQGPDLIFIPESLIIKHGNKLFALPYESLSRRDFQDRFVEGGEVFLTSNGSLALPLLIDPLMMYYNRDLFSAANIAIPPSNWSEFLLRQPDLTELDGQNNILQSAIAFGEYSNVRHAKEILSMLFLQAGDPIVALENTGYSSVLGDRFGFSKAPAIASLDFYTQFSSPFKSTYSWNRSLPNSRDAFTGGFLATYFGFASELNQLRQINPNLNFDAVMVPQRGDGSTNKTFGHIYGLAVTRSSRNSGTAFKVAFDMMNPTRNKELADSLNLAPGLRQALASGHADPFFASFYKSALVADTWLDPADSETEAIFRSMIESVSTGQSGSGDAVNQASIKLNQILR